MLAATLLIASIIASAPAQQPAATTSRQNASPGSEMVVVTPALSDKVRLNPGKGWFIVGNLADYPPSILALGSTNYERTEWSTLEPKPGEYNWSFIDSHVRECVIMGKQFAFGVMCANIHSSQQYVTPKWLFDMGAASYGAKSKVTGIDQVIPVWDDPIFLAHLATFAQALAKHCDGNPRISFIDIRSYGNWGEGHLYPFGGKRISPETLKQHVMNYKTVFDKTQLILPWGEKFFNPVYDWAIDQGIGLRRDGICGNSNGSETFPCLGKAPAVFEFFENYEKMKKLGWWDGHPDKDGNGHTLLECVKNGHPSYIGLTFGPASTKIFVAEQLPLIKQLANDMGYDFALRRAAFPGILHTNSETRIEVTIENRGVAPLYEPATLAVALLDDSGKVVERQLIPTPTLDVHHLAPGDHPTQIIPVTFTSTSPGKYQLAIGLFTDPQQPSPAYLFASVGSTPDRWLVLNTITIANH
jgi:hypothetical protein